MGSLDPMVLSEIDVRELAALGESAVVIDVREPDEWEAAHIAHAAHVPLASVPDQLAEFSGSPTYVICRSGGRSAAACRFAAEQGHDVVNVAGGMLAWQGAGLDVITGG